MKQRSSKKSLSSLKKLAWNEYSRYRRLEASDSGGMCICYTCGKRDSWKNMQLGHLLDGRNNSILFERIGTEIQCPGCNLFKSGNKEVYIPKFIDQYGRKTFDDLRRKKNETRKFSREELAEMREEYKKLADEQWADKKLL